MNGKKSQSKKKAQPFLVLSKFVSKKDSTRELMGVKAVTEYSLLTFRGDDIAMFLIKPTNVSVLSHDALRARVNALMNELKGYA